MNSQKPLSNGGEAYKSALSVLAGKALLEISRLKPPIIQFCGPISTGGFGDIEENLTCLSSVIRASTKQGISVFNQISYERQLDSILKDHRGYDYPLLDFFYGPILASKKIAGLVFLPLWETSIGSQWEHNLGLTLQIPILYMNDMFIYEINSFYDSLLSHRF